MFGGASFERGLLVLLELAEANSDSGDLEPELAILAAEGGVVVAGGGGGAAGEEAAGGEEGVGGEGGAEAELGHVEDADGGLHWKALVLRRVVRRVLGEFLAVY